MSFKRLVLPAPLEPVRKWNEPEGSSMVISRSTSGPVPYRKPTFSKRINARDPRWRCGAVPAAGKMARCAGLRPDARAASLPRPSCPPYKGAKGGAFMIVICPVCSTRYLVDQQALSPAGRLVRCANCSHTWHQVPPPPPPADGPRRIELTAAEPVIAPESGSRVQLPALQRRRSRWPAMLWGVYFLLILGAGGAVLWWQRDEIVSYWPVTARYYDLLGVPTPPALSELGLQKVVTSRDVENGLPTLVIEGEVVNVSKVAHEVPKLKVILQDSSKHELQSWSFNVTDERLAPGSSVPFRTSVAQPSEAVTGVVVTFDTGAAAGS